MIERLLQLLEKLVNAVGQTYARLNRAGAPAERAHLGAQCLGFLVAVVVVHRHVATGRAELARDRAADAARRTGHQRDFA